jgi:TolA-binding protein
VVARYEDVTGQFSIPPEAAGRSREARDPASAANPVWALTRDTWVRLFIWLIPMIFMAGTLYITFQSSLTRQEVLARDVDRIEAEMVRMALEQRVQQEHVTAVRAAQERLQPQLDALREQLSALREDIAVLRETLEMRMRAQVASQRSSRP